MTDSSEPQKTYAEKNRTNNPKLATDYKSILYIACAASMLKAECAFGSIVLFSNTSVVMVSSGQSLEILFLISNNDAS